MRKGIAAVLAIIVLVIALTGSAATYLHFGIRQTETVRRTVRDVEILAGINAVEFMKRSLKEALPYTIWQTSYDITKRGGYYSSIPLSKNCIPYWKNYSKTYLPDFERNLSAAILDLFDCFGESYSSSYPDIFILTADYKGCGNVSLDEQTNFIKAKVYIKPGVCSKRISSLGAEAPDFYQIHDNANFSDTVDAYTFRLFDTGKNFIQDDSILNAIESADESMTNVNGKNCKEISRPDICENKEKPVAEDVLNEKCPNADQEFKHIIESKISGLEEDYSGLKTDIIKIRVNHTGSCSWNVGDPSEDCECKVGHQECPPDADIDNGTDCLKCRDCCPSVDISVSDPVVKGSEFTVNLIYTHDLGSEGGVHLHWLDDKANLTGGGDYNGTQDNYEWVECDPMSSGSTCTLTLKALEDQFTLYYRAWDWSKDYDCVGRMDHDRDPRTGRCSANCDDFPDDLIRCDSYSRLVGAASTPECTKDVDCCKSSEDVWVNCSDNTCEACSPGTPGCVYCPPKEMDCVDAWKFVCDEHYRKLEDVKCEYDYRGDAEVLVKVSGDSNDNNEKYPVFDETLGWRVFSLRFYVLDGNWKETLPAVEECPKKFYC